MAITWSDTEQNKVSVINVGGQSYNLKDAAARTQIESLDTRIENLNSAVLHFKGTTTTAISDGAKTKPIMIGDESYTPENGDVVIYKPSGLSGDANTEREYVWVGDTNGKWQEFGSTGALKALAFKDNASGTYQPAGTVSQPSFTGTEGDISVSGTPSGTIAPVTATGTGDYTPAGTVSKPDVDVHTTTASGKYLVTEAGTAPTLTANDVPTTAVISSATYNNETLTFTSAVFAPGTAATLEATPSALTAVSAGLHEAPAFTGTATGFAFSGSSLESTGTFTPSGTVSQPTFAGTEATITVS